MYKLIFVDDEAIVRDGISSRIPWGENDFELSGLFEHGLQTLEYMETHSVDVVISDINMPRMDGLELSKIIGEKYPDVMVLLLTGYDEFEYAKEAIKSRVRDFLLKPITADELKDVLVKIKVELYFQKERKNQYALMKNKLEESFPLLKERFLYRLISGKLEIQSIAVKKEYFQWKDLCSFYQVSVVSIPEEWDELDRITLSEFIKSDLFETDEIISDRSNNIVILLQGESGQDLKKRSRELAEKTFLYASGLELEQVSAGCGEIVGDVSLLSESYRGACNAVDYSSVLGLSQILSIEEVRDRKIVGPEQFSRLIADFSVQLKSGLRSSSYASLEHIFIYLEEHLLSKLEASFYCNRIHFVMLSFIQEMSLFNTDDNASSYDQGSFDSLVQAREFFFRLLVFIENRIESHRNEAVLSRINKAIEIIEAKKGKRDFTLQEICNDVYLSTSQFSLLFKEGTGKTFIEYLTQIRIDEAKKLLKTTDMKSYEIAEESGFSDPGYFSISFKKNTGKTPMEYRRSLME
ncbi:MAG: response regulator [Spirochaetales bacterium]|nr:response regulator [Spirochaetales bacterium]